jgi:hypothetical protein
MQRNRVAVGESPPDLGRDPARTRPNTSHQGEAAVEVRQVEAGAEVEIESRNHTNRVVVVVDVAQGNLME